MLYDYLNQTGTNNYSVTIYRCESNCQTCGHYDYKLKAGFCTSCQTGYEDPNGDGVCTPECGDGLLVAGEPCDANPSNPGCKFCKVTTGYVCTAFDVCAPKCGDGLIITPETCDDKNISPLDGCSATCTVEDGYACSGNPSKCTPICGDAKIKGAEKCDVGDYLGCLKDCSGPAPGYLCKTVDSVITCGYCGDGKLDQAEKCDRGANNGLPTSGCSSTCTVVSGYVCSNNICTKCTSLQKLQGKCGTTAYIRLSNEDEETNPEQASILKETVSYTRMMYYGYLSVVFLMIQLLIYINRSSEKKTTESTF